MVDEAERFFFHFRNLDESAIEKTYLFCKNEYPIIENYVPATLNLKEDTTKVDVKKIKCIRKIFEYMLEQDELKKLLTKPKKIITTRQTGGYDFSVQTSIVDRKKQ